MYVVLYDFTDMQDGHHLYRAGDHFPRDGIEVKPERINELRSSANRRGVPLIKKVINNALNKEKAEMGQNKASQGYSEKKGNAKKRYRRKTE